MYFQARMEWSSLQQSQALALPSSSSRQSRERQLTQLQRKQVFFIAKYYHQQNNFIRFFQYYGSG